MSEKNAWARACDHVMPGVCRPAAANPPLPQNRLERSSRPPAATAVPAELQQPAGFGQARPSRSTARTAVAVRVGVFFDGTGNNASNTASGLLCGAQHPLRPEDLDASCKPYMSDPDSSYGNDVTNVFRLWGLYPGSFALEGESEQKRAFLKLYIEGIGTRAGEEDNLLGAGLGRGETGVAARVYQAFGLLKIQLDRLINQNNGVEIVSLTFDVFGFSRGAAAARHFANEVASGNRGPLREVIHGTRNGFSRFFVDQYQRDIQVGFIGLFDTVAAVGGLGNLGNVRSDSIPGLKLHLPRRLFPRVVHLVARDEYRANFPLSRVKPEHPEITLPGAHSDIGGGYHAQAEECLLISPMQALTVSEHTEVQATSIYRDARQAREAWLAQGWPAEMLEIVTPPPQLLADEPHGVGHKRVYAALQLKRPVRGELSRIYLRVMHALAREKGVSFMDIPDKSEFRLPLELQPLCNRFVAGDYSTTDAEEALLRLRYIHVSAHWNPPARLQGEAPRISARLFYINAPVANGVRVQHAHVPG